MKSVFWILLTTEHEVCVLHQHRSDGVVYVSIRSSAQQLPKTHLSLLCWRISVSTQKHTLAHARLTT